MLHIQYQTLTKRLLILIALLFSSAFSYAQKAHCYTDENFEEALKAHPEYLALRQSATTIGAAGRNSMNKKEDTTLRTIPVVFHVIHQYGKENISRQRILDQLKTINDCYRLRNEDTQYVRNRYKSAMADFHYRFVLATIDPNGRCTDGIDRIYSDQTVNAYNNVKSLSWWDNNKYLNIWVVESINSSGAPVGQIILGFAQFPYMASTSPNTDGIVVRAASVGSGNHTLVHEIGHWLGLFHPFQGGCLSGGGGDGIDDTPPVANPSFGCDTSLNTCSNDNPNLPDMIENFMDYADCSYMFTKGQKEWIDAEMAQYRDNIYSASNLSATGADGSNATSGCKPIADFYSNIVQVCVGSKVQFFNNSYYAPITGYQWNFYGATPSNDTAANPAIVYTNPGKYSVSLKVMGTGGSDSITKSMIINVLPAVSTFKAPQKEGFESLNIKSSTWLTPVEDDGLGWAITNYASSGGKKSIFLNNIQGTAGKVYEFSLPPIDMTLSSSPVINFKSAYARQDDNSDDQLDLLVSTDCGTTFNSIAYWGVYRLKSSNTNFNNIVYEPTTPGEWKSLSADLKDYKNETNLLVKFAFTNEGGNDIYIDDINIGQAATGIEDDNINNPGISISPNPATDEFTVQLQSAKPETASIRIYDITGKSLFSMENISLSHTQQQIVFNRQNINANTPGMYFIRVQTPSGASIKKLIFN